MNIQIINPVEHPRWDDLLLTADHATFFHSSAWARVLSESYGYKPLYFTNIEGGKLTGLIPVMEIDSLLTGKRGVSLPFTDFSPPVADSEKVFQALLDAVLEYGRKARWKKVELRCGSGYLGDAPASAEHFTHTLALDPDEGKVFAAFKSNTRRNIRRGGAEKVEVQLLNSREALADFYKLNCITRREHGLPPQPWKFFERIFNYIIAAQKGFVALVFHQSKPIAGAVYFHFRDEGIYKYGASDKNYQHLRPNNLIMWEAIRWFCRNGARTFSFGRTEPENEGLLQFKRGWATKEEKLGYYTYSTKLSAFVKGNSIPNQFSSVFKIMPCLMLKLVGNVLYRHVG